LQYKIKYHVEFEMDYGSTTKRFGNYILDDDKINNEIDAKKRVTKLFGEGNEKDLNPFLNFTRGKVISKKFKIDEIINLSENKGHE